MQLAELRLQAQCARDAREWFKAEYASEPALIDPAYTVTLEKNHYSTAKRGCFALVSTLNGDNPQDVRRAEYLDDVEQHTNVAIFSAPDPPSSRVCVVDTSECRSRSEWNRLTTPYLDE